jgi:hypothetical protein
MTTSHTEATTLPAGAPLVPEAENTKRSSTAPAKSRRTGNSKQFTGNGKPRKSTKSTKRAKRPNGARKGTKAAKVLELLRRSDGATLKELMKATGWQPHSVRGFLSGTIGKRLGLTVTSVKDSDGERRYSLKP